MILRTGIKLTRPIKKTLLFKQVDELTLFGIYGRTNIDAFGGPANSNQDLKIDLSQMRIGVWRHVWTKLKLRGTTLDE